MLGQKQITSAVTVNSNWKICSHNEYPNMIAEDKAKFNDLITAGIVITDFATYKANDYKSFDACGVLLVYITDNDVIGEDVSPDVKTSYIRTLDDIRAYTDVVQYSSDPTVRYPIVVYGTPLIYNFMNEYIDEMYITILKNDSEDSDEVFEDVTLDTSFELRASDGPYTSSNNFDYEFLVYQKIE